MGSRPPERHRQSPHGQSSRETQSTGMSLSALGGGAAVSFKGKPLEVREKPQATTTSASFVTDDELKELIARALKS
jgi:hypothetical protein